MPKTLISIRANDTTLARIDQLETWLETGQTDVIERAVEELYNREFDRRQRDLVEEVARFAREFSDKGELTEEETGYARAMLTVARRLPVDFDDLTDALLDHIENNKL